MLIPALPVDGECDGYDGNDYDDYGDYDDYDDDFNPEKFDAALLLECLSRINTIIVIARNIEMILLMMVTQMMMLIIMMIIMTMISIQRSLMLPLLLECLSQLCQL